jgi:hypothetical protein
MQDAQFWHGRWVLLTSLRLEGACNSSLKEVLVIGVHPFHFNVLTVPFGSDVEQLSVVRCGEGLGALPAQSATPRPLRERREVSASGTGSRRR